MRNDRRRVSSSLQDGRYPGEGCNGVGGWWVLCRRRGGGRPKKKEKKWLRPNPTACEQLKARLLLSAAVPGLRVFHGFISGTRCSFPGRGGCGRRVLPRAMQRARFRGPGAGSPGVSWLGGSMLIGAAWTMPSQCVRRRSRPVDGTKRSSAAWIIVSCADCAAARVEQPILHLPSVALQLMTSWCSGSAQCNLGRGVVSASVVGGVVAHRAAVTRALDRPRPRHSQQRTIPVANRLAWWSCPPHARPVAAAAGVTGGLALVARTAPAQAACRRGASACCLPSARAPTPRSRALCRCVSVFFAG